MIQQIAKFLHIEPSEVECVSLSVLYALFIGIVQCFVVAVPLAIFLAHYNSTVLPYIYIATAVVTLALGFFFAYFQKRLSFLQLITNTLMILGGSLAILWLPLASAHFEWLPIVLMIWGWVVFCFVGLIRSALGNQLFTLQQGKRIFGLLSAGQALGGIIAGAFLTLLENVIGLNQVILLTASLFLAILATQYRISARYPQRFVRYEIQENLDRRKKGLISFKSMPHKRYLLFAFLLIAVSTFQYYALDMLFNTEVQKKYVHENAMASFFGIFFAASDVLNCIVGIFVFGWMLEKLGLIFSLALLPVTIGLLSIGMVLAYHMPNGTLLFFWTLVFTRLINEVLLITINQESTLLLFQPLKPKERMWAESQSETSIAPLAAIIIGVILLWISNTYGIHIHSLILLLLATCIAAIALLPIIRTGYLNELIASLSKSPMMHPDFKRLDKESLELLRSNLNTAFAGKVIYILTTLEKSGGEMWSDALLSALHHPSPEVELYVLDHLERLKLTHAEQEVKQLFLTSNDIKVKSRALITLAAIHPSAYLLKLQEHLNDPEPKIATASLIALIKYAPASIQQEAIKKLTALACGKESERIEACHILQEVTFALKCDLLLPLLEDQDRKVKKEASLAASSISDKRLYPALIANLGLAGIRDAAFTGLLSQTEDVLPFIFAHFLTFAPSVQYEIIKLLGARPSEKTLIDFLRKQLSLPNRECRYHVLYVLTQKHYQATQEEQKEIREVLLEENGYLLYLKERMEELQGAPTNLLSGLLQRELQLCQERVLFLLGAVYPHLPISSVQEGFAKQDPDMFSYAVEILHQTLTKTDAQKFIPQITYFPASCKSDEKMWDQNLTEACLLKILKDNKHYAISEMHAAAVYTIGAMGLKKLKDWVLQHARENDPLMQESLAWALARL